MGRTACAPYFYDSQDLIQKRKPLIHSLVYEGPMVEPLKGSLAGQPVTVYSEKTKLALWISSSV